MERTVPPLLSTGCEQFYLTIDRFRRYRQAEQGSLLSMLKVTKIAAKARELAAHSWEYGVVSHALLEMYDPALSPFFGDFRSLDEVKEDTIGQACGLSYAKEFICTDGKVLIDGEGSAGDPASLGVAAILLGQLDRAYYDASVRYREVLLNTTPRYKNGAISHRENVAVLWSDFTFMALPFLAFSTFCARDDTLFEEIIRHCDLQKQVLQDSTSGLWKHIVGPELPDPGLWSSGNGWAVCGLVRVYALLQKFKSLHPERFASELEDSLETTITCILRAAAVPDNNHNGLLRNYIDDASYSGENAGTAAIASAIFRMSSLKPSAVSSKVISWAEAAMETVLSNISEDGIISPVADPLDSHNRTPCSQSAEGQAFTLLLIAAHRDWKLVQATEPRLLDAKEGKRSCW